MGAILNYSDEARLLARDAHVNRRSNKGSSVVRVKVRRLTPFEIVDLVERYEAGTSTRALASEFDVTRTTIVKHLRERGIDTSKRRVERKLTPAQVSRCAHMYTSGKSLAVIAKEFGVHGSTVRRELIRADIKLRPRRGWKY